MIVKCLAQNDVWYGKLFFVVCWFQKKEVESNFFSLGKTKFPVKEEVS